MVFVSHMTLQDHALFDFTPLKINHHPTMFGGHRHCGNGDIMLLVCRVISQDSMIKRSCDFMGRIPSKQVTILQSLVAVATLVVEL